MDVFFLIVVIGLAVWGFNYLLRWAREQDRQSRVRREVDRLEDLFRQGD